MKNFIFLLFTTLLVTSYIKLFFKKKKDFKIIQTNLNDLLPTMLCDKYPIYIEESIVNIDELILTTFKYEYWFVHKMVNTDLEIDVKTKSKFTLLQNTKDTVMNVGIKNEHDYVQVKLYPYNIIVLPLGWSYILDTECEMTELNDVLHKLLL